MSLPGAPPNRQPGVQPGMQRVVLGEGTPEERLEKVEMVVGQMAELVGAMARVTGATGAPPQPGQGAGPDARTDDPDGRIEALAQGERWWCCKSCRVRLGILDGDGVLRQRYKDRVVVLCTGAGGWVKINCWRCGLENMLKDEPREPAKAAG